MSTVNSSFSKLRNLAPALNQAADDAAQIIQHVETMLAKELNLGVNAEAGFFTRNISPKKSLYKALAFRRVDGKFKIAVVETIATDYVDEHGLAARSMDEHEVKAWVECPRDVKLESFPSLPELLENLIRESERVAGSVQKAKATVEKILAGFSQTGSDGPAPMAYVGVEVPVAVEWPDDDGRVMARSDESTGFKKTAGRPQRQVPDKGK